jgi:2-oxoglutarate/2-oxoacid ferredoxin oxidoreductase subunit beta
MPIEPFVKKYLRQRVLPTIWCSGCGLGTCMRAFIKALSDLDVDYNKLVVVSGIGCSSRMAGYIDANTVHTTHGRALPVATGIKLANPELKVVVIMGDGDGTAIGGNHLIHAARRNIDLSVLLLNNNNYGMTSGQVSPMTPHGAYASTSPFGNMEHVFELCDMVKSAGATYVARTTVYHYPQAAKLIAEAMQHKGFAFLEFYFQCPTYFGRFNQQPDAPAGLRYYKESAVHYNPEKPRSLSEGQFYVGKLWEDNNKTEYTELYRLTAEKARQSAGK